MEIISYHYFYYVTFINPLILATPRFLVLISTSVPYIHLRWGFFMFFIPTNSHICIPLPHLQHPDFQHPHTFQPASSALYPFAPLKFTIHKSHVLHKSSNSWCGGEPNTPPPPPTPSRRSAVSRFFRHKGIRTHGHKRIGRVPVVLQMRVR